MISVLFGVGNVVGYFKGKSEGIRGVVGVGKELARGWACCLMNVPLDCRG